MLSLVMEVLNSGTRGEGDLRASSAESNRSLKGGEPVDDTEAILCVSSSSPSRSSFSSITLRPNPAETPLNSSSSLGGTSPVLLTRDDEDERTGRAI